MPTLKDHSLSDFVKLLYIGDSGTGKTGSLASLVKAGYNLRILDLDNGLDSLVAVLRREFPEGLDKVEYETLRDKFKTTENGAEVPAGTAKAYVTATKRLNKWSDGSIPAEWGPDTILVIDSLTALSRAAYFWAFGLNPKARDKRQIFFTAQQSIINILALLTSAEMKTNVIVISHIKYEEVYDNEGNLLSKKGYPTAVGTALGPQLAQFFNTALVAETTGVMTNVKRHIRFVPDGVTYAKAPIIGKNGKLPLETGLAEIFAKLKGQE